MTILILHGIMGKAGENWMQWLNNELIKLNLNVIMPDLPNSNQPNRKKWFNTIKNLLQKITDDIIIVGHSLGVTSALDYCEKTTKQIRAVVSVAGFADAYGLKFNNYFLRERQIDMNKVKKHVQSFYVLYGDNDPYIPQKILKKLADDLGTKPVIIKDGGHINKEIGYVKLPEILEYIKTLKKPI